jgi:hypothetical protein
MNNDELHKLCYSPDIRMINSRVMRKGEGSHVEIGMQINFLPENLT